MSTFFISGIDTDIGKSVAVGMLARYWHNRGAKVVTVKLVQTGNAGYSEDIALHRKIMGINLLEEDKVFLTAPAIFKFPASPHLAANLEKRSIDLVYIRSCIKELEKRFDIVLIEGAGGLAVPLTEDLLTVDFAAAQKYPLILVSSGRLGSLNHTIMSIEMLKSRNIPLLGVIFNWCDKVDSTIENDSFRMIGKYLEKYGYSNCVIKLPKLTPIITDTDFSPFFEHLTE